MKAIIIAISVLLIGLLLSFLVSRFKLGDSLTLVTLLLLPLLAYGVFSGDIKEFTAPGGWGAKFKEVAREPIKPSLISQSIDDAQFIEKGGRVQLHEVGQNLESGKPVALTLQLDRGNYYVKQVISEYIRVLSGNDPNLSVIIIDGQQKYFASADGKYVLNLLSSDDQSENFMSALRSANGAGFELLSGVTDRSVKDDATNSEALRIMKQKNASRLVVVSAKDKPIGIVLRDNIVAELLVELSDN